MNLLPGLLLLISTTLLAGQNPTPKFKLVSDLDDTIKISHIEKKIHAGLNGLFTAKAFAGTSELFQQAVKNGGSTTLLSASPKFLKFRIQHFLNKNEFPHTPIILKNKMSDSTDAYKTEELARITIEDDAPLVLLSDDTEIDPEIFTRFSDSHPGKVAAIYIRRNLNRTVPAHVTLFSTVFEVALLEAQAGRLDRNAVIAIAESILNSKHNRILPKLSSCANVESHVATTEEFKLLEKLVNDRLDEICRNYRHDH